MKKSTLILIAIILSFCLLVIFFVFKSILQADDVSDDQDNIVTVSN
jgi:hypothetical protein